MIRFFDIIFSFFGLILLSPIFLLLLIFGFFDTGSPIFFQERVGKKKKSFRILKFRTMRVSTKQTSTHLVDNNCITFYGTNLRNSKLDELPQLWNVLIGDMSLVGPRPNLFNQEILIQERDSRGVYDVLPGITGLAQINNIDMSTPKYLAETDSKMIENFNTFNYFKCILLTIYSFSSSKDNTKALF